MSPKEEMDPFRLPAEAAERVILLLRGESSQLRSKEIQGEARFKVRLLLC